jgi:hypothetical protein
MWAVADVRPRRIGVRAVLFQLAIVSAWAFPGASLGAQDEPQVVELTMETMAELTMSTSFTIRQLNFEIEREQLNLKAQRARLKSNVNLSLTTPRFSLTSEPRWNSSLDKFEIEQEHYRRWEGELSIRQPVILFGWPTNGYLAINNRMYRYTQVEDDGTHDVNYYNRYYISYNQPLFQPNRLKNDLEEAEMDLEETQLDYYEDVIGIILGGGFGGGRGGRGGFSFRGYSVAEGYDNLLRQYQTRIIRQELVANLERALGLAQSMAQADSARAVDLDQVQVELANAREQLQSTESSIRLSLAYLKRELGLAETDSVSFRPVFELNPVVIDMDDAVRYAMELTPRMRQMAMDLRSQEIRVEEADLRGGVRVNLSMSYGRERRDEFFNNLWVKPDNSYSINITASVPVWDWGERQARRASSQIGLQQTLLRIEETELEIVSNVRNEVLDVRDQESRTMAMQRNLELAEEVARSNFQRYQDGSITASDLVLSLYREADTAENFLDAYLSWKGSLRSLQRQTYYDFEHDRPVLDWFREEGWIPENGFAGMRP